jgi:hypothetical protein
MCEAGGEDQGRVGVEREEVREAGATRARPAGYTRAWPYTRAVGETRARPAGVME